MRKTLTAAVALAPLWFLASAASATTTVSTGRTTPISTATANNGAPDDVDIASGGSITLNSPSPATSPAVTLNSNNVVTNEGSLNFKDVDNAVGILAVGGNTGSVTNSGAISITESTAPADTNSDGVVEAPFAKGTGRSGILVQGGSAFVGNIVNSGTGTIAVTGNNSFGINVASALTGNLTNQGSITVTGNNSVGISETGGVTGNVLVSGAVAAVGQGAQGVVLAGDVSGRFSVYSAISATGYGTTTRSATNSVQTTIQSTASEVQQGGPALTITGNIGGGVYIGAQPANTASTSTADVDGDGVIDVSEGNGSVTSTGSAPAILIGAAGKDVHLGALQFTTTPANPYGLIIAGAVAGNGIEDGVTATGVQIGDASGTGTVHIDGGVEITGSVATVAYGPNSAVNGFAGATALLINPGTTAPALVVSGTIGSLILNPLPNATTGLATPYTSTAYGVLIQQGASVSSLNVTGNIGATAYGDTASATALKDLSGSLSSVDLTGRIGATITPNSTTSNSVTTLDSYTGKTVALDLGANTTGVAINLHQAPQVISTSSTTNSVTTTTVATGPVVQNTTGAAITTSTTTNGVTTTTTTPVAPSITGDIILGSGPNTVNLLAGTIAGGLNLGSGVSSMTIDNGASYTGAFAYTGTGLSLNVTNGSFTTTNAATLTGTSLNVGAAGTLIFAVDPANNKATNFVINGTANFASGAKLGLDVLSTLTGTQTYQIVKATTLNVSGADATLAPDVPYLFAATVTTDQANNAIDLTIRPKTAKEIGLGASEGAALAGVYAALASDAPVQAAVFSQYTQSGFTSLYRQFLPEYTGGLVRAASEAARTISRLTGEPNDIGNPTGTRGAWAQQFFVGADKERDDTAGFRAGGFGYVAGIETGGLGFGAVGATIAFTAINLGDQSLPGDNRTGLSQLEGGVYWQGEAKGLLLDARAAAGYDWFTGRRQLVEFTSTGTVALERQTKESWTGYSLTGHFGAGYDIPLNATYYVRPHVQIDYFRLDEGAYGERFGGPAFDLNVASRTSDEGSGTASLIFGAKYGTGFVWRPQLEVGVRDVFAGGIGDTTAHYTGGQSFTITPEDISGAAAVLRAKIKASGEYYEVGFEAGGEAKGNYYEGDVKLSVRVLF